MMYKIPNHLVDYVDVVDGEDYLVKLRADELNVSKGWDYIPNGFVGASIMCVRGSDMFYFQKKLPEFDGEEGVYQLIQFKDYKKHKGLEEVAWTLAHIQGAEPRMAGTRYYMN